MQEITVLGNTFRLSRPELLPISLWAAWAYFVLRYFQLYSDLDDPEPREVWYSYADRIALRKAERDPEESNFYDTALERSIEQPANYDWSYHESWVIDRTRPDWRIGFRVLGTRKAEIVEPEVTLSLLRPPDTLTDVRAIVGVRLSRWDEFRGWVSVSVRTRFFTEYALPLVVAVLPLAVELVLVSR